MGLTPQQSLDIRYRYYEVFDKNRRIRYGITSDEDKEKIEEKYPGKYVFDEYDLYDEYIWLERLEKTPRIRLHTPKSSFSDNILLLMIIVLTVNIIVDVIYIMQYAPI